MLSIDVSTVLPLLSATCQSQHVFVFKHTDQKPFFYAESESSRSGFVDELSAHSFSELSDCLPRQIPSSSDNSTLHKIDDFGTCQMHILYLVAIYSDANTIAEGKSPKMLLGMYIDQSVDVNGLIRNSVKSLANLLQFQIKQGMALRALAQSEGLFKEISSLNKDYIYVKDEQGKVIFANKAIISLFPNSTYHEIVEQELVALFEEHTKQPIADIELIVKSKGEYQREEYITLQDGTLRVMQTVSQRFHINQETMYLLVVSRDITEREIIIKDLKRSNQDLDNFAYVASHDLKAPLNVIKRLVSWVMEDCADILPRDSIDDLELVMSRANRMEQLLKDLLAYSRIGKEYQLASEVNVKAKVVELLSLIDLPMGFVVNCDDSNALVPEVPFGVVLLNLISNAIKHHDSGNAKIQIKVRRNKTSNVITIVDDGPGIDEQNRVRIFDLFETLKPRDEVEGSGMGLSVVKRLVEHYGGHIKVEEHRPRGIKFIVYWPFNNVAQQVLTQLN